MKSTPIHIYFFLMASSMTIAFVPRPGESWYVTYLPTGLAQHNHGLDYFTEDQLVINSLSFRSVWFCGHFSIFPVKSSPSFPYISRFSALNRCFSYEPFIILSFERSTFTITFAFVYFTFIFLLICVLQQNHFKGKGLKRPFARSEDLWMQSWKKLNSNRKLCSSCESVMIIA